jgi:hypothetical protein
MHPYRSPVEIERDAEEAPPEDASWASGELAIAAMLGAVGALGVAVGVVGQGTWELSAGTLLLLLGAKVAVDERRSRSVATRRG